MPESETLNLYAAKAQQYFTQARVDLVSLLPRTPGLRVLEIGAGGGDTLVYIKHHKLAEEVVGVDIFRLPGTNQQHPLIDQFLILDVEKQAIDYPAAYFDVILCGDVVEHLADPWKVIKTLSTYLKKDGLLVISTPNFRHIDNFVDIYVRGDFKYNPAGGLLDKTHLRFFCKKNIADLVNTDELTLEQIYPVTHFKTNRPRWFVRVFNVLTFHLFDQFTVLQYVVVGRRR